MYTNIPTEIALYPWFKIVDFLQQNWAVIIERDAFVTVVFYDDNSFHYN